METTVSSDRECELCTKIVRLATSHGSVSMWRNIQGYTGWNLKNLIHDDNDLAVILELGLKSGSLSVRAHSQGLIDGILHSIADELAGKKGLFDRQTALRDEIENNIINRKKVGPGSVPRNRVRDLLEREERIIAEIGVKETFVWVAIDKTVGDIERFCLFRR